MKTTYYQILSHLPKIPADLLERSLSKLDHHEFLRSIYYDLREDWRGQIPYHRSGSDGIAKKLTKAVADDELKIWIYNNITQESQSIAFCKSVNDTPESSNVIAHTDRHRLFTLIYLLDSGGDDHATVFYRNKNPGFKLEPNMSFNDYEQLEEIERISVPIRTWTILDAQQPHSIENIPGTRFSIQVGLSRNPW
jgi:hypothetical protein